MPDSSSEADVTLDSSTSTAVVETASTTVTPETTEPTSVLDAVEAALKNDGVEAGSPPAANRSEEADPKPTGDTPAKDDSGDLSEEDKKQFSPRAQERIRDLATQKNELRGQVEQLTSQLEPLQAKASNFDTLTGYLSEHNISAKEANNALEITRLIKGGDYDTAMKIVAPIYQELAKKTGGVLDSDLREDVRLGHIPLARAQEIQRGRVVETNTREREQVRTETEQRRDEDARKQQITEHVTTVAKAADDWAKGKAASDPDWNQKVDLVAAQVNVMISRDGFPKSVAEATAINEKALAEVEKRIGAFRPAPKPINPARPQGSPSARDLPAPKTALEALERGLQAT